MLLATLRKVILRLNPPLSISSLPVDCDPAAAGAAAHEIVGRTGALADMAIPGMTASSLDSHCARSFSTRARRDAGVAPLSGSGVSSGEWRDTREAGRGDGM